MTRAKRIRSQHAHNEWVLRGLPLPGHVIVLTDKGWRRGWLVARESGPNGWIGLVQYDNGDIQITEHLPADCIASSDLWLTNEPAGEPGGYTSRHL